MPRDLDRRCCAGTPRGRGGGIVAVVALVAVLSACSPGDVSPTASPGDRPPASASAGDRPSAPASPLVAPTATAAGEPALVPEGSAGDNLPLFAAVTASVWASDDRAAGRAYVDALVSAGFDKAAMQVTHGRSTVGEPAESIQFSVRWDDECLIGQVGPATGDPVTVVAPALAEGTCLVGRTRAIDW